MSRWAAQCCIVVQYVVSYRVASHWGNGTIDTSDGFIVLCCVAVRCVDVMRFIVMYCACCTASCGIGLHCVALLYCMVLCRGVSPNAVSYGHVMCRVVLHRAHALDLLTHPGVLSYRCVLHCIVLSQHGLLRWFRDMVYRSALSCDAFLYIVELCCLGSRCVELCCVGLRCGF